MATAGFDSPSSVRGQLQTALYWSRKRRREWRVGSVGTSDWAVSPVTGGAQVTVSQYQGVPTAFQYSVDGGTWTAAPGFAGSVPFVFSILGLSAGARAIRIRTLQGTTPGPESGPKSVTVA